MLVGSRSFCSLLLLVAALPCAVRALALSTRRGVLRNAAAIAVGSQFALPEAASADDELISVYFGCGCFWHVQVCGGHAPGMQRGD